MDGHMAAIIDRRDGNVVGGPGDRSHISAQRWRAGKRALSVRVEVVGDIFCAEGQLLMLLDGATKPEEVEVRPGRTVLLVVKAVCGGVGEEIEVAAGVDGAYDPYTVLGLHEGVIILISRPLDIHFVAVHNVEGVCTFVRSTGRGIENIFAFRVSDIVCIVTRIVGVLHAGILEFHRKTGEINAILRKNDTVRHDNGDGKILALVFVKGGEGHAVRAIFIHQQVNTILGLFTDFQFNLACGAGIRVLGRIVVKTHFDGLDETGGERCPVGQFERMVVYDVRPGIGSIFRNDFDLETATGRNIEWSDGHIELGMLASDDSLAVRNDQSDGFATRLRRENRIVRGQVHLKTAGDIGRSREFDFLDDDGIILRVRHLELCRGEEVFHREAQFIGTGDLRLFTEHRELLAGEMRLVAVAGLHLSGREIEMDFVGGNVLFYIGIDGVPVVGRRQSVHRSLEHVATVETEPGRPESIAAGRGVDHGNGVTL